MEEKPLNQLIWAVGTISITFAYTLAFLLRFNTIGMYVLILLPMLSFYVFKKTTSIFDTDDEERERMRQDALSGVLGSFGKSLKVLQVMGYVTDLTDMSYKKDEWTESERATIETALLLLSENVERRKAQKPLKLMHPEEIKYLVEQKRKQKEVDTFVLLKEERKRREQEIAMLEELMKAEKDEHPEADGIITDIEADIIEIKKIEEELDEIEEEVIEFDEIEDEEEEPEEDEELETLKKEVEAVDKEIGEVEDDDDYEDEEPLIRQGKIYEKDETEVAGTGFAPVEKKSLRDVLGAAMSKLKEVEDE